MFLNFALTLDSITPSLDNLLKSGKITLSQSNHRGNSWDSLEICLLQFFVVISNTISKEQELARKCTSGNALLAHSTIIVGIPPVRSNVKDAKTVFHSTLKGQDDSRKIPLPMAQSWKSRTNLKQKSQC